MLGKALRYVYVTIGLVNLTSAAFAPMGTGMRVATLLLGLWIAGLGLYSEVLTDGD